MAAVTVGTISSLIEEGRDRKQAGARSGILRERSERFTNDVVSCSRPGGICPREGWGMDRIEAGFVVTAITSGIVLISSIVWLAMM
jgi:hypothetical protein